MLEPTNHRISADFICRLAQVVQHQKPLPVGTMALSRRILLQELWPVRGAHLHNALWNRMISRFVKGILLHFTSTHTHTHTRVSIIPQHLAKRWGVEQDHNLHDPRSKKTAGEKKTNSISTRYGNNKSRNSNPKIKKNHVIFPPIKNARNYAKATLVSKQPRLPSLGLCL